MNNVGALLIQRLPALPLFKTNNIFEGDCKGPFSRLLCYFSKCEGLRIVPVFLGLQTK